MGKVYDWFKDNNIIYLVIGFIFSIFSIERYNIVISIYIWPFCFLQYLHKSESKVIPLIIVSLCLLFSNMIRCITQSNLNIGVDLIIGAYFSIINIIPFVIDGILYEKIHKWQNVLLFPLSVAICEFLFSFNVIANFNIYAYAHRENIQFLQIISFFGCYFLSFVIALFSSILDYSIILYKEENQISKYIYLYVILIIIIYAFGIIRLLIPEEEGTFNIASSQGMSQNLYENEKNSVLPIEDYINYINDTMKKAKNSDADIMIYAEEAFAIYSENKTNITEAVQELAKQYNIYVLLPLDICYDEFNNTNEAILINNNGTILYNYQKQHLIPYIEKDYYEYMDEVKAIDTNLGIKMTVAICYDINFPYFLNSLSRNHFDLLLVPSWDWDGIAEFHSNEAKYRAIEGGFNLIKNTANGIVISNDYKGRTLSYYIGKNCEDYFVISTVNKKGVKTLYSYIGFLFNYLYIFAFICVLISGKIKDKITSKRQYSYGIQKISELDVYNEVD